MKRQKKKAEKDKDKESTKAPSTPMQQCHQQQPLQHQQHLFLVKLVV
jgi:hypothetical protein